MNQLRVLVCAIVVLAMAGSLVSLNGCSGSSNPGGGPPPPPGKIKHVVIIFQENRSTDNLFQDPKLISAGADIQNYGIDSLGNTVPLKKSSLAVDYDPGHGHTAFNEMCDLDATSGQCKMDGADLIHVRCNPGALDCPAPDLTFGYVDPAEVAPYFQMAEQYTFADHMFQTNQGPSFPAHQFIISGTSAPCTPSLPCPGAGSSLFASENPNDRNQGIPDAGCDAPPTYTVSLIDPTGNENSNNPVYPCFDHQTVTDLLEAKGRTWRYYAPGTAPPQQHGSPAIWVGPEAIQHICGPNAAPPNATACVGADYTNNVILNQKQVLTDIAANHLKNVTWVIPDGADSDHAGPSGTTGPSWVASIVNAIGNSPYWADTAIFITWDDWGGWYDHVPPPQVKVNCSTWGCGYVYGFRVPLIVVSPYAKPGYISKQQHDFGSILKFTEGVFGLPSLGYADAVADDLSDCFNYNQAPLPFHTINAPVTAQYFLNRTAPPTDPDDD
jgi:phospholipase C